MKHKLVRLICLLVLMPLSHQATAQQTTDPCRQLQLFCGATLGYADTNWLRLYDLQIEATPGLRWHLGHDWSITAQGLIPIVSVGYTYRDITNKYWRFNMATVSRQLHFNSIRQHLRLTAGLFGDECYGVDVRWAWPVSDWLLLSAQAGLTASWIMGTDFKGNSDVDFYSDYKLTGLVGANVYLQPQNIEFRLSGGQYTGGNYGSQLDVMRHFSHITLLAFAQLRFGELEGNLYDGKKYRTNGGFKIIWMLPPYKKSCRKLVVRPASNFVLSHNSRADRQSMQTYRIDPEENSREWLVNVDWGLRKEASR